MTFLTPAMNVFWVSAGVSVGENRPRMKNHEHLHLRQVQA